MARAKRKSLNKKLRFEIFKRDKFTCQYCGEKAPNVVLQVDHIKPVAEGGKDEILNLVTSCGDCNSGKGARLIEDSSVVERQRHQIEELEERRQQLEMMLQWRDELSKFNSAIEQAVNDHLSSNTGYSVNKRGLADIRKWLKAFPLDVILSSVDDAFGKYGEWKDGAMTTESWGIAFNKVPSFCRNKIRYGDGPDLDELLYVQGIVRNRIGDRYFKALPALKEMRDAGFALEDMRAAAKQLDDSDDFDAWIHQWLKEGVE